VSEEKESYFSINPDEQSELLNSLAPEAGVRASILEKDIWLCLVMEKLFTLPDVKPMAFKGGTSLSKVYRAIERFSEDVDITIDWRSLHHNPPDSESLKGLSKNKVRALKDEITTHLERYISDVLMPGLKDSLKKVHGDIEVKFETKDDGSLAGDKLRVYYPAVTEKDAYVPQSVLIEFGSKNAIEPGQRHNIAPDLATMVAKLTFPSACVEVLSPQRTFWEKATLIHDECHRPASKLRANVDRMARHWYDLARLSDHDIGVKSLANADLLNQIISVKKQFFSYGFSRYDLCNAGGMILIPRDEILTSLEVDYKAMLDAGMFYGKVISFESIVDRLSKLQKEINSKIPSEIRSKAD
jgi:uncharacterized protein YdcH (DUF465 family)